MPIIISSALPKEAPSAVKLGRLCTGVARGSGPSFVPWLSQGTFARNADVNAILAFVIKAETGPGARPA